MDPAWCYLCRVDRAGVDPQVLWGIALDEELADLAAERGPMSPAISGYLRFLCEEFDLTLDPTFTQGEAARVIPSLLADPATDRQNQTIAGLSARARGPAATDLTYAAARTTIRRLVALQGLRSA